MTDADRPALWRVAVVRDEDADGPWHLALREAGFEPVSCPVVVEGPAPDPARLATAAQNLDGYDWVICASARSVRAISAARGSEWPAGPKAAAVGAVTAAAMRAAGSSSPIVATDAGAAALWDELRAGESWPGRRVLVATVPGGRGDLIEDLRAAGAIVDDVDCYRMRALDVADIARSWAAARPDALLVASPASVRQLVAAVGVTALQTLRAVVPIGRTTAAALSAAGIDAEPPPTATFEAVVDRLAELRAAQRHSRA